MEESWLKISQEIATIKTDLAATDVKELVESRPNSQDLKKTIAGRIGSVFKELRFATAVASLFST